MFQMFQCFVKRLGAHRILIGGDLSVEEDALKENLIERIFFCLMEVITGKNPFVGEKFPREVYSHLFVNK